MKWYTTEPRKDCPILVKGHDKYYGNYFYVVKYNQDSSECSGIDKWIEYMGEEYAYWERADIEAWTTFEELEKDFQKGQV